MSAESMVEDTTEADSLRKEFVEQVLGLARLWGNLQAPSNIGPGPMTPVERTEGLAFSILNEIDGGGNQPGGYSLVTRVPDDEGEEIIERIEINANAALHEEFAALSTLATKG